MNQPKLHHCLLPALLRLLLLTGVIMGAVLLPAQAQTKKITGKVIDETGAPVERATVRTKDNKSGTVTGSEGQFTLAVKPGATLIISAIGYENTELSVGG